VYECMRCLSVWVRVPWACGSQVATQVLHRVRRLDEPQPDGGAWRSVTPVTDASIKLELQAIIDACLWDKCQAWDLQPDGRYRLLGKSGDCVAKHPGLPRPHPESKLASGETLGLHQAVMDLTSRRVSLLENRFHSLPESWSVSITVLYCYYYCTCVSTVLVFTVHLAAGKCTPGRELTV